MELALRRLQMEVFELHQFKVGCIQLRSLERDAVAAVRRLVVEGVGPVSVHFAIRRHALAVVEKRPGGTVVRAFDFPPHRQTVCPFRDRSRPDSVGIDDRRATEVVGDGNGKVLRFGDDAVRIVHHSRVVVVEEIGACAAVERSRVRHAGRRRVGFCEIDGDRVAHGAGADLRGRRDVQLLAVEVDRRFGRDLKRRAEAPEVAVGSERGVGERVDAAGKA